MIAVCPLGDKGGGGPAVVCCKSVHLATSESLQFYPPITLKISKNLTGIQVSYFLIFLTSLSTTPVTATIEMRGASVISRA